jgi:tRNA A37 threonylcarbamoyladenosine dehydratase
MSSINPDQFPTSLPPLWERTHILIGDAGVARLREARLLLAGLGGVGSFAAEALARMGVGHLTLVDSDQVAASNLNRQLVALESSLGKKKVEVMTARVRDINPRCSVVPLDTFLQADAIPALLDEPYDYVVDAIDSLNSKVSLIATACEKGIPVASSMGAGGRLDPTRLSVGDLMDSEVCPLARVVRQRLRRRGVGRGVLAVWSTETPRAPLPPEAVSRGRPRAVNGTVSYMPPLFGMMLAGAVIQRLCSDCSRLCGAPK